MIGVYFSGTGNTRYCVNYLLNDELSYSIENPDVFDPIKMNNEIIFGYPIYFLIYQR